MSKVGIIGKKLGMSQLFNKDGTAIPVTLLAVDKNVVLYHKTEDKHGYSAVAVATGRKKNMAKPLKVIASKAGVESFSICREFRVPTPLSFEVGQQISVAEILKVGQLVSVIGTSRGKGFAGSMKRWNFSGLEASHGVSISHRAHGATGNRQDPGKVFKNKKMAGHLGVERKTVKGLRLVNIRDYGDCSVLAIKGAIPGGKGSFVLVQAS